MKKPTYILTKELSEHLTGLKKRLDFLESENKKHKKLQAQYEAVISKLNKMGGLSRESKAQKEVVTNTIKEVVTLDFVNKLYGK